MINKNTIKEAMPADDRIWTCDSCGAESDYATMMEHECKQGSKQGSNARFETVWAEWIDAQETVRSLINAELLRNIAGYFYFQGATDATKEARAVLADTVEEVRKS